MWILQHGAFPGAAVEPECIHLNPRSPFLEFQPLAARSRRRRRLQAKGTGKQKPRCVFDDALFTFRWEAKMTIDEGRGPSWKLTMYSYRGFIKHAHNMAHLHQHDESQASRLRHLPSTGLCHTPAAVWRRVAIQGPQGHKVGRWRVCIFAACIRPFLPKDVRTHMLTAIRTRTHATTHPRTDAPMHARHGHPPTRPRTHARTQTCLGASFLKEEVAEVRQKTSRATPRRTRPQ